MPTQSIMPPPLALEPGCYVDGSAGSTLSFNRRVCAFVDGLTGSEYEAECKRTDPEFTDEVADEAIDLLNGRLEENLVTLLSEQSLFVTEDEPS